MFAINTSSSDFSPIGNLLIMAFASGMFIMQGLTSIVIFISAGLQIGAISPTIPDGKE